jgi:hypothetical protein
VSTGQIGNQASTPFFLHPSVGTVDPDNMSRRQRVAAVAKVRCLEHDLFEGDRVSRSLSRNAAEALVSQINDLRRMLGWLEIDLEGQWRWPHDRQQIAAGS